MKKTVSIILCVLLITAVLPGCASGKETLLPVHVEGSIFGGAKGDSIGLDLKFSPKWISEGDNHKYNPDLAAFSALISADSYFRTKDLEKGTQNRVVADGSDSAEYTPTELLSSLGFSDVSYIESYKTGSYETDLKDSVTMTMGYYNDRGRYDVYVIAIRGCFSSGEWDSFFDAGSDSNEYIELTGEHPEWTDANLLKGTAVASARAMDIAKEYLSSHGSPSLPDCILITGHSRGGAVAEVIGAGFEDDDSIKSFTYTFDAAAVSTDSGAENCATIFNILDSRDFLSGCLPFGSEAFYRYGRTMSADISERSDVLKALSDIKGKDDYRCMSKEASDEYRALFKTLFPDRKSLYETHEIIRCFDDEKEAEKDLEECRALISSETGLALEQYCSASDVAKNADGKYEYRLSCCNSALLQSIGRILAYGQSASDGVKNLFRETDEICSIADLIISNAADISAGHRLIDGYVLSGYIK